VATHETKITELRIKCESFIILNKIITTLKTDKVSDESFKSKMKEIENDYVSKKQFEAYKSLVKG